MSNTNNVNSAIEVTQSADSTIQLTVPLTITVRLGALSNTNAPAPVEPAAIAATPTLKADSPELQALLVASEGFHDQLYIPHEDSNQRDAYYDGIDTSVTPAQFFDSLSKLLKQTHNHELGYSPSSQLYPWVDRQPDGGIRSIYTGEKFDVPNLIRESFCAEETLRLREESLRLQESLSTLERTVQLDNLEASLSFNCEHVVPQSWFRKQSPMRGDLHHLFACETRCNSFRGNTPYFDFTDFEEKVMQECGRNDGGKFEPSQGKAEVARATLYFLLRYPNVVDNNEMPLERLPTIIKWAKSALPSDYEKHRNAAIFDIQGNRNPLIDHPEWIDKIDFQRGSV